MNCFAHQINNAKSAGLILTGQDEYGVLEWTGTREQHATFKLLESNPELL